MKRLSVYRAVTLTAVGLLLAAPLSHAGETYYKWQDENGRPVHSDRPPPKGTDYQVISSGTGLRREVDSSEGAVPRSVEPTEGNQFEPVEFSRVKIEKNPELCARARENLEVLNSEARIRMRNDQGEIYYLSQEDRDYQRKNAEETIEVHCD